MLGKQVYKQQCVTSGASGEQGCPGGLSLGPDAPVPAPPALTSHFSLPPKSFIRAHRGRADGTREKATPVPLSPSPAEHRSPGLNQSLRQGLLCRQVSPGSRSEGQGIEFPEYSYLEILTFLERGSLQRSYWRRVALAQ